MDGDFFPSPNAASRLIIGVPRRPSSIITVSAAAHPPRQSGSWLLAPGNHRTKASRIWVSGILFFFSSFRKIDNVKFLPIPIYLGLQPLLPQSIPRSILNSERLGIGTYIPAPSIYNFCKCKCSCIHIYCHKGASSTSPCNNMMILNPTTSVYVFYVLAKLHAAGAVQSFAFKPLEL